ncbi:hypothetical protein ACMATS_35350 [Streptoverticillium reticulum]
MKTMHLAEIDMIQADAFDLDLKEIATPTDETLAQHPSLGTCFCTAMHC